MQDRLNNTMNQKEKNIELLAPAGSWEAFKAAVENGADAIFLGGKSFSARANAANFSVDELEKAVRYAHERKVKVYVTVNIVIADQEFPELIETLYTLYMLGVDAVILQDPGVAWMLQTILPEMVKHASTQMTVNNSWGVRHMEKLGFHRVILAREVSAQEMREMAEQTAIELEVFVHGALCIGYSGQCLMSSFIGGRSGNRGTCAQPCRMGYQLVDRQNNDVLAKIKLGEHLLSPKDMNLIERVGQLREIGVDSLKIEGRMKRPEYVATVTRLYRQALDRSLVRQASSLLTPDEHRELTQIFNRDFTTGFFEEHPKAELMSYSRPNNRGIRLGRIVKAEKGQIAIKLEAPLHKGDGIEVWTSRGREGITIGTMISAADRQGKEAVQVEEAAAGESVELEFYAWANPGDRVFKTYDALLMQKAQESYQEGKERRKRPLLLRFFGSVGEKARLEAQDGSRTVTVYSANPAQQAVKRPLTAEYALQQLGRLGTTPFQLQDLVFDIKGAVMIPVSELNEMRRQAVEELLQDPPRPVLSVRGLKERMDQWQEEMLRLKHRNPLQTIEPTEGWGYRSVSVAVSSLDGLEAALAAGAKRLLLGGEHWQSRPGFTLADIQQGVELCHRNRAEAVWRWPRVLNQAQGERMRKAFLQMSRWELKPAIMVSNFGELEIIRETAPEWPVEGDYALNIFNEASLAYFRSRGAGRLTLSPELNQEQLAVLAKWPATEMIVFGDMEMMVSEYCPLGAALGGKKGEQCSRPCRGQAYFLKDRMSYHFPIETDLECRMHLFNSKTLNLYPALAQIAQSGIGTIRLQLNRATEEQIRRVVPLFQTRWKELVSGRDKGGEREVREEEVMAEMEKCFPEGFTKGHFFRGVIGD